jgi:hypothetical protein
MSSPVALVAKAPDDILASERATGHRTELVGVIDNLPASAIALAANPSAWRQVLCKRQGDLAREPLVAPIKMHLTLELAYHIFRNACAEPAVRGGRNGRSA